MFKWLKHGIERRVSNEYNPFLTKWGVSYTGNI